MVLGMEILLKLTRIEKYGNDELGQLGGALARMKTCKMG